MNKGCIYMLVTPFILAAGIVAGMLVSSLVSRNAQEETCFEYAREKGLPDIEYLELTNVVIASNQFRGHVCNFTDTRTGTPVVLQFDEADIPYGRDTFQVMSMVVPFLCIGAMGSIILESVVNQWVKSRPETNSNAG